MRWWRPGDLQKASIRKLRQAQGDFENQAIRQHLAIDKRSPAVFPRTVKELVINWVEAHPANAESLNNYPALANP